MVRLLLVDDDPDILRINRAYLERREYGVDTAESAEAALRLLDGGGYDCLVLDVKMKGEDGFALCREIRRRSPIPVIFLTSLSEEECLEQGFLAGGDDYMTKPYSLRELELRIAARVRAAGRATEDGEAFGDLYVSPVAAARPISAGSRYSSRPMNSRSFACSWKIPASPLRRKRFIGASGGRTAGTIPTASRPSSSASAASWRPCIP